MRLKKILKYLMFLLLVVSMGVLYGFSNRKNGQRTVANIQVEFVVGEHQFLTHSMVNKLLIQNDSAVKNQAKSVIDLYSLEQQVLENPYIEKASLYLCIDGSLKSVIKQRTPIARIIGKSEVYYIDEQGVKMPLSENYSARVPLVTGIKEELKLREVHLLLQKIVTDDFLKKEIIGIHFNPSNECLFTVRSGDYTIDFGQLKQMDQKFKKLKAFYNKAFLDSTIQTYKTINIKYHNQVVGVK